MKVTLLKKKIDRVEQDLEFRLEDLQGENNER